MVGASAFCANQAGLVAKIFGWFGVGFFSLGFIAHPFQGVSDVVQHVST
jgi:hypothetical protein